MRPSFTNEKVLTIYKEMRMFLESLHDMAHSSTAQRKKNQRVPEPNFQHGLPVLGWLGSQENFHEFFKSTLFLRGVFNIFMAKTIKLKQFVYWCVVTWRMEKKIPQTEKKIGPIMSNFLDWFFQVFMGKKNQKHCSVPTKKLHKMKLIFFSKQI